MNIRPIVLAFGLAGSALAQAQLPNLPDRPGAVDLDRLNQIERNIELDRLGDRLPQDLKKPQESAGQAITDGRATLESGLEAATATVATPFKGITKTIASVSGRPQLELANDNLNRWVVKREWLVAVSANTKLAEQRLKEDLGKSGLDVRQVEHLEQLQITLVRFFAPQALDSNAKLSELLHQWPEFDLNTLDRHLVYQSNTDTPKDSSKPPQSALSQAPVCTTPTSVGMVDGPVEANHSAFNGQDIVQQSFIGQLPAQNAAHGTAVAGILIGSKPQQPALLKAAKLYVGQVFFDVDRRHQGAALQQILQSLNWLARQPVSVINMSLSGPNHPLLSIAVERILADGRILVAAAGNQGPAAPPQFPAAYEGVIAVTAVDNQQTIYRWANQGDYIDFAAPGVSVLTARAQKEFGRESGTSLAAPWISARLACMEKPTRQTLRKGLIDVGEPGKDPVFGEGIVTLFAAGNPKFTE